MINNSVLNFIWQLCLSLNTTCESEKKQKDKPDGEGTTEVCH